MNEHAVFGSAAELLQIDADLQEHLVEEDQIWPIILASMMYCPAAVLLSIAYSC